MSRLIYFAKSSIGAKIIMASTGIFLVGFVLIHMLGNLLIFSGADILNAYAQNLKNLGPLLWIARIILLISVLLHILSGLRLTKINKSAKSIDYKQKTYGKNTFSARTMALSGLFVLAFIIYHLLHFTGGIIYPEDYQNIDSLGRHHVYNMIVLGFQRPVVSLSYTIAIILLGLHLNHGVSSMFQSLGLRNLKYTPIIDCLGPIVAVLVVIGNTSIPVAVLMGYIKLVGV